MLFLIVVLLVVVFIIAARYVQLMLKHAEIGGPLEFTFVMCVASVSAVILLRLLLGNMGEIFHEVKDRATFYWDLYDHCNKSITC